MTAKLAHAEVIAFASAGGGTDAVFDRRIGDAAIGGVPLDFGGAEGEFGQEACQVGDFPTVGGFLQRIALIGQPLR